MSVVFFQKGGMGKCRSSGCVLHWLEESRKVVIHLEGWKVAGKRNESSCQRACPCFVSSMV